MKGKITCVIISAICVFVLCFMGCAKTGGENSSDVIATAVHADDPAEIFSGVSSVQFIVLKSSDKNNDTYILKCKNISDHETIANLISYINSAEKQYLPEIDTDIAKGGYSLRIVFNYTSGKRQSVSMIGSTLTIGSKPFSVNENFLSGLNEIYESIDIEEQDYSAGH